MGIYYDPTQIRQLGKSGTSPPDSHDPSWGHFDRSPPSHRTVLILNNGIREIAPDVTDREAYAGFVRRYRSGEFLTMHLFHISEEDLVRCQQSGL